VSFEILSNVVVIAINLIVGGRVLKMGIASRAAPELLLGATLLFDGLEWLFWLIGVYTPLADTPLGGWFVIGCRTGIFVSMSFQLQFVRRVFRPDSSWARIFTTIVTLTIATGLFVGTYLGDEMGFASGRIWIWLELGGAVTTLLWCALEAGSHYLKMRRRIPLGLADPVVANRVLLWSCYGAANAVSQATYMMAIAIAGAEGVYPYVLDGIMSTATSIGSILIWLAFFPPLAYLRFLSRKYESEAASRTP
jgi:hypothetical protein